MLKRRWASMSLTMMLLGCAAPSMDERDERDERLGAAESPLISPIAPEFDFGPQLSLPSVAPACGSLAFLSESSMNLASLNARSVPATNVSFHLPPPRLTDVSGFAYPAAYRCDGTNVQALELDAPLRTRLDPAGQYYYSFSVEISHPADLTLDGALRPAGMSAKGVELIAAPTATEASTMRAIAHSETGRRTFASFRAEHDRSIQSGKVLGFVAERNVTGTTATSQLVLLVPAEYLWFGAELSLYASNGIGGGARITDTLRVSLARSPKKLAVLGDSMAWGQGLTSAQKHSFRVANGITNKLRAAFPEEPALRVTETRAHSGAQLQPGPLSSLMPGCTVPATTLLWQESPSATPNIPCQMGALRGGWPSNLATSFTFVPTIGVDLQSTQVAVPTVPSSAISPTTYDATFKADPADSGPRYDYVLVHGCANDVGIANEMLIAGQASGAFVLSPSLLNSRVDTLCQQLLGARLQHARAMYPNAKIVLSSYHQTFTRDAVRFFGPDGPDLGDIASGVDLASYVGPHGAFVAAMQLARVAAGGSATFVANVIDAIPGTDPAADALRLGARFVLAPTSTAVSNLAFASAMTKARMDTVIPLAASAIRNNAWSLAAGGVGTTTAVTYPGLAGPKSIYGITVFDTRALAAPNADAVAAISDMALAAGTLDGRAFGAALGRLSVAVGGRLVEINGDTESGGRIAESATVRDARAAACNVLSPGDPICKAAAFGHAHAGGAAKMADGILASLGTTVVTARP